MGAAFEALTRYQRLTAQAILIIVCAPLCAGCEVAGWSPGIGDPTVMGWVTAFAYFLVAYLCLKCVDTEKRGVARPLRETIPALLRVVRKHWPHPPGPARRALIWFALAVLYFLLGLNKQLDLQTLVNGVGRMIAFKLGLYDQRRPFQAAFVLLVGLAAAVAFVVLFKTAKEDHKRFPLVFSGVIVTLGFVFVRASTFHEVDWFVKSEVMGIKMNWIFELSGISLVGAGAVAQLRSHQGSQERSR